MQTKLTLHLEEDLKKKAKIVANKKGKSLSKLVADHLAFITSDETMHQKNLSPHVKSLYGSLANEKLDESNFKDYLEKKHL